MWFSNRNKRSSSELLIEDLQTDLTALQTHPRRAGDTLVIESGIWVTKLRVQSCDIHTHDGLDLDFILSIDTDVPFLSGATRTILSSLNALAALSALVMDRGHTILASRMPIFRGETAINEYCQLAAMTAVLQPIWLTRFLAYAVGNSKEQLPSPNIPGADDPCRWTPTDFKFVGNQFREFGMISTDGEAGVTSEFPWEQGAISALHHHQTSLFEMRPERNPLLGNGLFYKLELPTTFPDKEVSGIAAALNESEWNATDAAPMFGAWCPAKSGDRIAFVGFQPNALRGIGMHLSIAMWNLARSHNAVALLKEFAGHA